MAISDQISRLISDRNTIRDTLTGWGIDKAVQKNLTELAEILSKDIANKGAVTVQLKEGETYTIPAGYHNGGGTVTGVAGGGNYQLQAKGPITPSRVEQAISPDVGYFGLSSVKIGAIPAQYQDVTSVTATQADILAGKRFVDKTGAVLAGTMKDNGNTGATLTLTKTFYTIPEGYHAGGGQVSISLEAEKTATLGTSESTIQPANGKLLSTVKIPSVSTFLDGKVSASAGTVLEGDTFVDKSGTQVTGTMADNGNWSATLTATHDDCDIPEGYHAGGGSVWVDFVDVKTVTPTKSTQNITETNSDGEVIFLKKVVVNPIENKYQDVTNISNKLDYIGENVSFVNHNGTQVTGKVPIVEGETYQFNALVDAYFNIPNGLYIGTSTGTTDVVMMDSNYNRIYRNWEQTTLSNGYTGYKVPFEFDSNDTDIISAQVNSSDFGCEITPTGIYVYDYNEDRPGSDIVVTITYSDLNGGSKVEITRDLEDALAAI